MFVFNSKFSCQVYADVIRADGSVRKVMDKPVGNLMTNNGMAALFTVSFTESSGGPINWHHRGTGQTPTRRDSGSIVASQSGFDVVADGAIFEAGDVGRLINWNSGEQCEIVTFTDSQNVVVDRSQTVTDDEFTIYYINRTTLGTSLGRTQSSTGSNSTAINGDDILLTATRLHAVESSDRSIDEIGLGSADSTSCGHIINISPVVVLTGERLRTTAYLRQSLGVITSYSSDPTTGLGNFAGTAQKQNRAAYVYASGTIGFGPGQSLATSESGTALTVQVSTASQTLVAFSDAYQISGTRHISSSVSQGTAPSAYPWTRTRSGSFNESTGNITIGEIALVVGSSVAGRFPLLLHVLTSGQAKTSLQTFRVDITHNCERVLTN